MGGPDVSTFQAMPLLPRTRRTPRTKTPVLRFAPEAVTTRELWPLRLSVAPSIANRVFGRVDPEALGDLLGLEKVGEALDAPDRVRKQLAARITAIEALAPEPDAYLRNARVLAERLELGPASAECLAFLARKEADDAFSDVLGALHWGGSAPIRVCATATGADVTLVRAALAEQAPLRRLGLVGAARGMLRAGRFQVDENLAVALSEDDATAESLIGLFMQRAPAAELGLEDFAYLEDRLASIVAYVRGALRTRARGANVLLHGPPGTGKTELTRTLAAALGATLYEVPFEDSDGDPSSALARLNAVGIADRVLSRVTDAMLVFDEFEDVFGSSSGAPPFGRGPVGAGNVKAWMHRLLEEASVPTLWVGNSIEGIDRATLRRFDFVMELGLPPDSQRRRLVERASAACALPPEVACRIADDARATPAHVAQAHRVANLVAAGDGDVARAVPLALDASLAFGTEARREAQTAGRHYDLAFVNASVDLDGLTEALRRSRRASLLLAGPPGTGKTAYVSHLARALDVPLHAIRMSDVLDPYVGGTERKLARAFAGARSAGALLFVDEIDGLLRDRMEARARWEVSQVNELLTQLESFEGLFACATNLRDSLDPASLRRFAVKVDFRPLRADQRVELLRRMAGGMDAATERRLGGLEGLCAGDYAAVDRRLGLLGRRDELGAWVESLAEELTLRRSTARRGIGFS